MHTHVCNKDPGQWRTQNTNNNTYTYTYVTIVMIYLYYTYKALISIIILIVYASFFAAFAGEITFEFFTRAGSIMREKSYFL